jgi:phosphoribosylformylglycinamidine cyclo-ligase
MKKKNPITYKEAGVNIDRGEDFIKRIGRLVKQTHRKEVLPSLSGFSGLFALRGYTNPILVSSTDGVGTKLLLASLLDKYEGVGIDLVAMNVDDVLAMGAEPLFFLDYIASGKIDLRRGEEIIRGIAKGCKEAGCSLLGGETAEMPQFYTEGQYELVGFAVGVLEKRRIIDGSKIRPGDKILGLPSSGLHSNGFSLVRKTLFGQTTNRDSKIRILKKKDKKLGKSWGEALLIPTRIYVKSILPLIKKNIKITGLAHITGGGLIENIKRLLPNGCQACISACKWKVPPVFTRLEELENIRKEEMYRVFNMGIGMAIIVSSNEEKKVLDYFQRKKETVFQIGEIVMGEKKVIIE